MSEEQTDPIEAANQEAEQLGNELSQKAAEAGYSDIQQFINENRNAPEVQQIEKRAQGLQQKYIEGQQQKLYEKAPELQDPEHARSFVKHLKESKGFTDNEIAAMVDHRTMAALHTEYKSSGRAPKRSPKFKRGSLDEGVEKLRQGNTQVINTAMHSKSEDELFDQMHSGHHSTDAAFELMRRRSQ